MSNTTTSDDALVRVIRPAQGAQSLLRHHWDGSLPVRPEVIAKHMGVVMIGRPADYPYSGYFSVQHGRPCIEYNESDPLVRQRFTIAHELGHYVLGHKDSPRDGASNFGASVSDPLERAANQFAAELLMPASSVGMLVRTGKASSVEELARVFQVSKVAMGYRMANLDLA